MFLESKSSQSTPSISPGLCKGRLLTFSMFTVHFPCHRDLRILFKFHVFFLPLCSQNIASCCFVSRFAGKQRSFHPCCTVGTSIGIAVPRSNQDKATQLFINTRPKILRELPIKKQYQLILLVILPSIASGNQNQKIAICYQLEH